MDPSARPLSRCDPCGDRPCDFVGTGAVEHWTEGLFGRPPCPWSSARAAIKQIPLRDLCLACDPCGDWPCDFVGTGAQVEHWTEGRFGSASAAWLARRSN